MIEAKNITVEINSKKLLDGVSLEIRSGEVLAVLGPNGAGKSTLRKVLCGDLIASSGEVLMYNKPLGDWSLPERAKVRAVLPQESSLNFPFSVLEVVLMGRAPHLSGAEKSRDYEIARAALEAVDELKLEQRIYPTLSGGERQRVQLARVLAQIWERTENPRYMILDEPTSNLDIAHQHGILKIARRFAKENVAVMVILHDLNLAMQYADKILLLKDGKVNAFGKPLEILTEKMIYNVFNLPARIIENPFAEFPIIIPMPD